MNPMTWPDNPRPLSGGWSLTTDHPASSHGLAVLVSPRGDAYGPGDWLTVAQVAELRGITIGTARNLVKSGSLKVVKFGVANAVTAAEAIRPKGKPGRRKNSPGNSI